MSKQNQIDDLFREKLSGVQAGGYSDAAWGNAKALLDGHFRFLLFKKLLLFTLPVAALFGIAWFSLPGDLDKHSVRPIPSEVAISDSVQERTKTHTAFGDVFGPSVGETPWTTTNAYHEIVNAPSTRVEALSNAQSSPTSSVERSDSDRPSKTSSQAIASIASKNSNNPSSGMLASASTTQLEQGTHQPEPMVGPSTSARRQYSAAYAMESETRSAQTSLDEMPTFAIGNLGAGEISNILSREKLRKEAPDLGAPVAELTAGFGYLVGQSLASLPSRMIGGGFISLQGRFNFNERFFASSGMIYSRREAVIGDFSVVTPTQKLQSRSVGYLDIPLTVGYRFGARHSLSFGMAFSPLLNVDSEDVGSGSPWDDEIVVTDEIGPRSGFASFDVAGLLGYRFQLSSRWFADAQLRYGLFDLTDDAFFLNDGSKHHNHQMRVGLSYRLLNR